MKTVERWRLRTAALLALTLAACSNVPQGYGSGDYTIHRRVEAPMSAVWEAAREYLRDRGDAPEVTKIGDGGTMRTGDMLIEVGPGKDDYTRLSIHQAKYVGTNYEERCVATADAIVALVR